MSHRKDEEASNKEIWPATPEPAKSEKHTEEVAFCHKLDCLAASQEEQLAW
jgi:hypothetical protein